MNKNDILIEISQLEKIFCAEKQKTYALKSVDLSIKRGEYLSIQGPSGGGKSTLLSIIGLLERPTSGRYVLSQVSVESLSAKQMAAVRNREIGFIFQDFNLIGDMSVAQNVALPLIYAGVNSQQRQLRVNEVLSKVGLLDKANNYPGQLSGGQQQRVAVARAIVTRPALLLADEPTGNLDSKNGDAVMQLLAKLNQEGTTLVMVTHDTRYANHAKRVVHLWDGELLKDKPQKVNQIDTPPFNQTIQYANSVDASSENEAEVFEVL